MLTGLFLCEFFLEDIIYKNFNSKASMFFIVSLIKSQVKKSQVISQVIVFLNLQFFSVDIFLINEAYSLIICLQIKIN